MEIERMREQHEEFWNKRKTQMWRCRYILPDGRWQSWMVFEDFHEVLENCQFHGQGRPFEIVRYEGDSIEDALEHIEKAISLMEKSRQAFKSKTIALARSEARESKGDFRRKLKLL